jgi:long-chain fatty acid transport protein
MRMTTLRTFALSGITLSLYSSPSYALDAGGPSAELFDGAIALGQAMAMTSKSSLLSMSFNAAGLAELEGTQISAGLTPGLAYLERNGPTSSDEDQFTTTLLLTPNLYIGSPIGTERFYFGLAVTAVSGFGTDWSTTGTSKYLTTESEVGNVRINPTVAFKVNPNISVGVGVDYVLGSADLRRQLNVTGLNAALGGDTSPDPDGTGRMDLEGTAWGYNLGVLFDLGAEHGVGVSYRSQLDTEFEGPLTSSGLTDESAAVFGGTTYTTDVETTLPFPDIAAIGYTYRPAPTLDVTFEAQWADWSVFNEQKLDFTQETDPARLAILSADNPTPRNWRDTYSFAVGTEYRARPKLTLRSGTYYAPSPVPNSTFDPGTPFLDRIGLTLGAGYEWSEERRLDFGMALVFHKNRNIDNDVGAALGASADGKYKSMFGILGLSFSQRF